MTTREFRINSNSPEDTRHIGAAVGAHALAGDIVLLTGDLGAGKTCFTQGVLKGLGSKDNARSPTFVLATEYPGRLTLYHIDLYRLDGVREIEDLGLDEYLFGDGVCVVEWAEKAGNLWPEDRLAITIERLDETARRFIFTAHGARHGALLESARSAMTKAPAAR
ncbi:MAG: tRNA (adenosine(37)-N6)-threonylcarbamoyltransferase complex ATPase subunit type 1 TsaE [SAR202 cluster bacterium]|nr:tRNA (adenosine(37)-N6)-threonylcarbamoyltransferase complex ATPase subunit type 1 TsaE [SAR202 cluster bacterium]